MLVVLPVALAIVSVVVAVVGKGRGSDFLTFWDAGRAVLHGHSPYPALQSLPASADRSFAPYVYPPAAALALAPLSLLPFTAASIVFLALDLAAVALALRLLGVTDWRCYGVAYASAPVCAATGIGTISPLLLLGVAAAWRYRNRALAAGLLVGLLAIAKLFLWPLWLWLLCTRRFRAAAVAAIAAAVGVAGSWAVIGFAGVREYPHLLSRLTQLVGPQSYSVYALVRAFGVGHGAAQSAVYVVAAIAIAAAVAFVRGDRRWLIVSLAVALLATPIAWPHYLVLLFVPIALARRSFSYLWMAPLAFWLDTTAWSYGNPARILGELALAAAIVAVTLRSRPAVGAPRLELGTSAAVVVTPLSHALADD